MEALASVALISLGIAVSTATLGRIAQARSRAQDAEEMQRLALQTYDEILALKTVTAGHAEGDYLDRGEKRFRWRADRTPTGEGNLELIRVEVSARDDGFAHPTVLQGLVCGSGK